MISLIFFALAALCNSLMDTSRDHFSISILPKNKWWDGVNSWKNKYIDGDPTKGRNYIPVQLTDCWHFFKTLMLTFIILSIMFYEPMLEIVDTLLGEFWRLLTVFCIYGAVWVATFNFMYDKILLIKTWKK